MKLSFEIWASPPYPVYDVVNTWGDKSIEEQARKIAEIGYQGIEITYPFIERLKWENKFEETAKRLKQHLPSLGLEITSVAHHVLQCIHPWPWIRKKNIEYFKEGMVMAKKTGAEMIHSLHANAVPARPIRGDPTGRWHTNLPEKEAWNMAVNGWRKVCEKAEEVGINVSIEPMAGDLSSWFSVDKLIQFMNEVGSDRLYTVFDICMHTWGTKNKVLGIKNPSPKMSIPEAVEALGHRIGLVHLKDVDTKRGKYTWLGIGDVDWLEFIDALKAINYRGYCTVEWEGWFPEQPVPVNDMELVARYAKNFFSSLSE